MSPSDHLQPGESIYLLGANSTFLLLRKMPRGCNQWPLSSQKGRLGALQFLQAKSRVMTNFRRSWEKMTTSWYKYCLDDIRIIYTFPSDTQSIKVYNNKVKYYPNHLQYLQLSIFLACCSRDIVALMDVNDCIAKKDWSRCTERIFGRHMCMYNCFSHFALLLFHRTGDFTQKFISI